GKALPFPCVPLCPLWLRLLIINRRGHRGTQGKSKSLELRTLIQLLVQRPVPRPPRVGTDATEFVVKRVQVFAQQPHHFHREVAMFTQKFQEVLARNESRRRLLAGFSRDPIALAAHAFAQSEHRSRTDNLQQLLLAL